MQLHKLIFPSHSGKQTTNDVQIDCQSKVHTFINSSMELLIIPKYFLDNIWGLITAGNCNTKCITQAILFQVARNNSIPSKKIYIMSKFWAL